MELKWGRFSFLKKMGAFLHAKGTPMHMRSPKVPSDMETTVLVVNWCPFSMVLAGCDRFPVTSLSVDKEQKAIKNWSNQAFH